MAAEDEEEAGFIVSDGHLSVCEYDFSQDGEDDEKKLKDIELRRERIKQQRQQYSTSGQSFCITESSDAESRRVLADLRIVSFGPLSMPLSVKKPEKVYELGQGDPNAILRFRPHLIRACYSSLESKQ